MKIVVIVILLGFLVGLVEHVFGDKNAKLPKEFTLCKPGDDVCLLGAITSALKLMRAGMPKMGALAIDPLHVSEVKMMHDAASGGLDLTFKNVDIFGISNTALQSAKGEFEDTSYWLELSGTFPTFTIYGDYILSGKITILPIRGNGKENLTYTDLDFTATLTGTVIQKEGVDYVRIDDATFDYLPTKMFIHLSNLFDGNKELGDNMNKMLNENWRQLLYKVHPAGEEMLGSLMKAVASRVYEKVPYRNIHPKK